jgi:hypothetical protein
MQPAIVWLSLILFSWGFLISVVYGAYEIAQICFRLFG